MAVSSASDSMAVIAFLVIICGTPVVILILVGCIWWARRPPRCLQCSYRHLPIPARVECPYVRNPPSFLRWFTSPLNASSDIEVTSIASVFPIRRSRRARREERPDEVRPRRLTTEEMEYWIQEMAPPLPVYLEHLPAHEILIERDGCTSPTPSYRSPAPSYVSPRSSLCLDYMGDGVAAPPSSPVVMGTVAAAARAEASSGAPLTALPPAITRKSMRTLQRGRWLSTASI